MTRFVAYVARDAFDDDDATIDAFAFDARSIGVEVANVEVVGRSTSRVRVAFDATTRDATRVMRAYAYRLARA